MDKLRGSKFAFAVLATLAIVLAVNAPSEARGEGAGGHSFGGGHVGGFDGHHGFDGHRGFDGHHGFDGHGFHHGFHGGVVAGPAFPFYGYDPGYYPTYGYQAPSYYWYCSSYGAYYPSVATCPEDWVPVPTS